MTPMLEEARPKTLIELSRQAKCPEIVVAAEKRGVSDVVHFTTLKGAVGVLASGALKSRGELEEDEYLEHVYRPNVPIRKDPDWVNYVSLSIQRINDWFFDTSNRWRPAMDNPWVVLCFDVGILAHAGVVFTTTNNIYPSCRRAEGICGFMRMFDNTVRGRYNHLHTRTGKDDAWPTDRQAEVLYPRQLSCNHLRRIDVQLAETEDSIAGILGTLDLSVSVRHAPEVFE